MASRKPTIPNRSSGLAPPPIGVLELERFSSADLDRWQQHSGDLNEFTESLYFGVEPARRRYRSKLLFALQSAGGIAVNLENWARIVSYQYSLQPLSCAGSLQNVGGRFNAGYELDDNTLNPWPALYLADSLETAFREKFQLASSILTEGLTPKELALEHPVSHTTVFLKGHIDTVFDMTTFTKLNSVGKIFREIKPPKEVTLLARKLKIKAGTLVMVQSGAQLHKAVTTQNWRVWPMQFGMPAPSQMLAELIRAARYEGILYPSSKGPGKCLAVFPDKLSDHSHIDLIGPAPSASTQLRLDANSAHHLEGWDSIPRNRRPL